MPDGLDVYGMYHGSRRWARSAQVLAFVGVILIIPAWVYFGLLGVALVILYNSVVLPIAILGLWSQFDAIRIGIRGTKDESDFMEAVRYGEQTHKRIRELQFTVFKLEKKAREMK